MPTLANVKIHRGCLGPMVYPSYCRMASVASVKSGVLCRISCRYFCSGQCEKYEPSVAKGLFFKEVWDKKIKTWCG